ncbi:MAG: hypothetical protein M0Z25_09635 [Nitrospiraceae bacterium]|nr:hypothetical protein [Nitrospiraceae bacterium]
MAFFAPLLSLLLIVFVPPGLSSGAACPAGAKARLGASIEKLQHFIAASRSAPSFNYDRLDYLLDRFGAREKEWASCGPPERSRQDRLLRSRLSLLRQELARERSLLPGSSPAPVSAFATIENLLSGLPGAPLPASKGGTGEGARPSGSLSRPLVLLLLLAGGVLVLLLAFRATLRRKEPGEEGDLKGDLSALGLRWARFRSGREEILEALKKRLGQGRGIVLVRAQLLKKREGEAGWTVVDEVVSDEGGQVRTFGEGDIEENLTESLLESSLGDNETRTRAVLPLGGVDGEEVALVVDALSAPEIEFLLPDPSGLRNLLQMKEILFELARKQGAAGGREPVGVISFLFDDPEKGRLLEGEGEDFQRAREFIVSEIGRLTGDSMAVFGEPPGIFHLVVSGWSEAKTGMLVKKIAEGLGPEVPRGETGTLEKPWFRKVLVAYTHWDPPDPERLDAFLGRIRENVGKLLLHPSIGTVIDH